MHNCCYYNQEHPLNAALGIQIFFLLVGIVPITFVYNFGAYDFSIGVLLAYTIIFYSGLRLSMFAMYGEKRLITMTFYIYVYVFLGFAPFLQSISKDSSLKASCSSENFLMAYLFIFVGLFFYEIGKVITPYKTKAFIKYARTLAVYRIADPRRILYFSIVAGTIAIILTIYLGGTNILFLSRYETFLAFREVSATEKTAYSMIIATLLRVPVFVAFFSLWILLWNDKKSDHPYLSVNYKVAFFVLLLINLIVNNPISLARYWFGTIIFSLAFTMFRWHKIFSFTIWSIGMIMLIIVVFPFADMFRYTTEVDIYHLQYSASITKVFLYKADFDSFKQIVNSAIFVENKGLTFGRQFLGTLLFWFPRSIWTTKPLASGVLVAGHMGYVYTNLSMPLWGEAYIDGGLIGIMLCFTIYGFLTHVIEEIYLTESSPYLSFQDLFVPCFAAYQIFMLRGSLMPCFAYFVPLFLCLLLITKKI